MNTIQFARLKFLIAIIIVAMSQHCWQRTMAQSNWPQFRGPQARGVGESERLPTQWSSSENVEWKTDIPGRGWSSPVVWGDSIFITTVISSESMEEARKGLYFGGERPAPKDEHVWKVMCLELATGSVRWEREVHRGKPATPIHIKSSYASETAVTDGKRVVFCFGNVGIFCFDLAGNELWTHRLEPRRTRMGWGPAASPAIHGERVYYVFDNDDESYLLALDMESGNEVWRVSRDEKSNWSTPYVWVNAVRTEIVTLGSKQVRSYDLDGNLLWNLEGMSSITIATPYESDGLLYISSGYVMDGLKPIYAIRPGAGGDVSLVGEASSNEYVVWAHPKAAPYNPSTLVYEGRLYVLYDRGLLACYDAATGREIYGTQRLPKRGAFTASPWAYNGHVFCLNEDGETIVIRAGDEFEVLHVNSLADEDDMGMASPAIVGDRLLIRTESRIYSIRNMN